MFNALLPEFGKLGKVKKEEFESPSKGLFDRLKIVKQAWESKSEIYHITGDVNFAAFGLIGKKSVLTIHDLIFYHKAGGIRKIILGFFWLKAPCFLAKRITTISEETRKDLISIVPKISKKISVIPNPLTISIEDSQFAKKSNPIVSDSYILLVGTKDNKNITRQLEAIKFAGWDNQVVILGEKTKEIENAQLLFGSRLILKSNLNQQDLYNLYINAEFLMFCSIAEGFGLPILEAQYFGCPVLTSNCSSMPEVGDDAVLYADPFDVVSMKNKILEILENPELKESLITKGFSNISRFTSERIASEYFKVYMGLVNGG